MVKQKSQIATLIRQIGTLFTTSEAAIVLSISGIEASKILSRWAVQGCLTRVRRGLYTVVPLEATDTEQTLDDPWLLIPELYSPGYLGGWSATEYWDYTEQLFRDICVFTEQRVLHKQEIIYNIPFYLSHIPTKLNFGTQVVWKKNKKILISDPHKTIIDGMYNPLSFGGAQHLIDCLMEYIKSKYHSPDTLVDYALRMENGAVFKRLGYLYSTLTKTENALTELCQQHLTQGIAYLDPSIKTGSIINSWKIKVPDQLQFQDIP